MKLSALENKSSLYVNTYSPNFLQYTINCYHHAEHKYENKTLYTFLTFVFWPFWTNKFKLKIQDTPIGVMLEHQPQFLPNFFTGCQGRCFLQDCSKGTEIIPNKPRSKYSLENLLFGQLVHPTSK